MDVTIQGLNMRVHETIEDYARRKLDRLDRYLPGISEIRLDLSHEQTKSSGHMTIAEITIRHRRGAILRAEERVMNGDFQTAINLAIDKMYRQIERFKGKRIRKGRGRFVATPEELSVAEEIPNAELYSEAVAEDEAAAEPDVVRRKQVTVSAMTEDEAIEQMELLGHTFFLYYDPSTASVNVVYKRETGGYGILQPTLE